MLVLNHLENDSRELESKILCALHAAALGMASVIAEYDVLKWLSSRKQLGPAVFHTKSLTPSQKITRRFNNLVEQGLHITAIDEEAGIFSNDFDGFSNLRYGEPTLSLVTRVFCWGPRDYGFLKNKFGQYSEKLELTGSPRMECATLPYQKSEPERIRPFVLVSSNFGINARERFWKRISSVRRAGFMDRDPGHRDKILIRNAEGLLLIREFAAMAEAVAVQFPDLDVIVRPHPVEELSAWKEILNPLPNLKVERRSSAISEIRHAQAVIHNGCTTAVEAFLAKTPVITFRPLSDLQFELEIPNSLGRLAESRDEVCSLLESIKSQKDSFIASYEPRSSEVLSTVLETNVSSARAMAMSWRKVLGTKTRPTEGRSSASRLHFFLGLYLAIFSRIQVAMGRSLEGHDPNKVKKFQSHEVQEIVSRLGSAAGLQEPRIRVIGSRAILVYPN